MSYSIGKNFVPLSASKCHLVANCLVVFWRYGCLSCRDAVGVSNQGAATLHSLGERRRDFFGEALDLFEEVLKNGPRLCIIEGPADPGLQTKRHRKIVFVAELIDRHDGGP